MKVKCLIVDDEPLAIRLIKKHLEHFQQFDVVAECENAIDASLVLQNTNVDLIFLDIQMPEISGIDFLKSLHKKPNVIITSAYKEYAIDGFDLDVIDFLLKPITFNRFFKAINKYLANKNENASESSPALTKDTNLISRELFIKDTNKTYKINPNEIQYIEGMREYIKIYTDQENIITKSSLTSFLEKLPTDIFLRVHKSFIINTNRVRAFSASSMEVGNKKIPIGRSYKINTLEVLNKK